MNGSGGFTGYEGGNDLGVSPDGKRVFALATVSDTVATFTRDLTTGKLTFVSSHGVGDHAVPGAPGLCFSPDGRFLYVADEAASAVVGYRIR